MLVVSAGPRRGGSSQGAEAGQPGQVAGQRARHAEVRQHPACTGAAARIPPRTQRPPPQRVTSSGVLAGPTAGAPLVCWAL